jgi:hypothetical protein
MDDHDGPIAAPHNHKVIFENELVRVLDIVIPVGTTAPLHTHLTPTLLYRVSGDHSIRRDVHGEVMRDTRADPAFANDRVMFQDPTPLHTLENTGSEDIHVIGVELKEHAPA